MSNFAIRGFFKTLTDTTAPPVVYEGEVVVVAVVVPVPDDPGNYEVGLPKAGQLVGQQLPS